MKNLSAFTDYLQCIVDSDKDNIANAVATEALNHSQEYIAKFFEDLLSRGCVSGMISDLVYYKDTRAFFDKHYYEIMELKEDYEYEIGEPMVVPSDIKNSMAWWAYQNVAAKLYTVGNLLERSTVTPIRE